jgi:hypothetical protein
VQIPRLKLFVEEVLGSLPQPHTPDVIDDAFQAVEGDPAWRKRYDQIAYHMGKAATRAWAGFWIAHIEQLTGEEQVPAKATMIDTYSRLTKPAPKRGKKVKEPDAVSQMAEHYRLNRDSLPSNIGEQRDVITTLIMSGISTPEAFALAVHTPQLAR